MFSSRNLLVAAFILLETTVVSTAFATSPGGSPTVASGNTVQKWPLFSGRDFSFSFKLLMATETESKDDGVVELSDNENDLAKATTAPFLSQGAISNDALNPNLSDPKEARVIIYMILSLIPVLFLIPLMLASRDLIPLDALPPVDL
jgi:hypothetical protein